MSRFLLRLLLVAAVAVGLLGAGVASPAAAAPPGDWTFIRDDGYRHWACKQRGAKKDRWRIRTATSIDNDRAAARAGIGVWAAVARRSNRNFVAERSGKDWDHGWIRFVLRGAAASDRLWIQSAGYGPVQPWSDGFGVRRITRCSIA